MNARSPRDPIRWLQTLSMLVLAGSVCWFICQTLHWPVTGDASLMHYVTFLMDHGRAPYRDICDMNLPMSYAPSWCVSHLFGAGDLPWRLYDLALLMVAGGAMYVIARPYGAFPAVWAGCLFALIHGRDGLLQVGQRDLFAAVLLVVGVACQIGAMRGSRNWLAACFGVCAGAAAMIKPTFALFLMLAFVEYFAQPRSDRRAAKGAAKGAAKRVAFAVFGWLMPVFGCVAWLGAKGSLRAFWYALIAVEPYHARIGHAPTGFLFSNSVSPIAWLVAAWVIVRLATRLQQRPGTACIEGRLLLLAAGLAYVSYLVQQRGYPYHRYPYQIFLLMLVGIDLSDALRRTGFTRWMSVVALVWASVVLAPVSAVKLGRYEWRQQPFRGAMEDDLYRIARSRHLSSLDGQVQCLDSISGCIATLDQMRVVQSTGLMYDEFLFNPRRPDSGGASVVDNARAAFLREVEGNPPLVFIVSAPLFPSGPDGYRKLDRWPEFRDWLNAHYVLDVERTFTVAVRGAGKPIVPAGYRVYTHK